MSAFWGLFLLLAYGCFTGLVFTLRDWLSGLGPTFTDAWVDKLPLIGAIDMAMAITLAFLALGGFTISRFLNRPKSADLLIETEGELRKVTWPSTGETWSGTIAVIITVVLMLCFLYASDLVLSGLLSRLMGGR
jgi:preprotein translocase SecE subunit